jgi:hypothetical protein
MPAARRFPALLALLLATVTTVAMVPPAAHAATSTVASSSCTAPAPGQFGCDAQVLVSRRTGHPVHPRPQRASAKQSGSRIAASRVPAQAPPQPLTPAYLQQAYDLTYLSATKGAGDTIAVVAVYGDVDAGSDLSTFRSTYGLPACTTADGCFQQLNEQGQSAPLPVPNSPWTLEQSLDLDAVSSLCPNCRIVLVEASSPSPPDVQAAITAAIQAGANQVSISGSGEYTNNPFTNFSAPGVAILAASGDDGVSPAGYASYPAALPYVTAVGGTSLTADAADDPTPRGVTESAWSDSGAGCDTQEQPLPYQPADGCDGRMYSDVSADADPDTGLSFYDSQGGGWFDGGGTSLATPLTAAFEAVTSVDGSTPQWAYADSANLNDPVGGSTGGCAGTIALLCNGVVGYDGPTGAGSISGQIVAGAPGIGEPPLGPARQKTYVQRVTATAATLLGGVYPNGEATSYYWQYGRTTAYGMRTPAVSIGSGTAPVTVTGHLKDLSPTSGYHFRLVATNAMGTTYGYDYMLTTVHATVARAKRARPRHHAKRRAGRG